MRSDHIDASSFNTQWKSGRFSHSRKVLSGNVQITQNGSIVNAFDANGGTWTVTLPPLEAGRFYVIANTGASGTLNVVDALGAAATTLAPAQAMLLFASDIKWTGVAGSFTGDFGFTGPGHSSGLVPDPGIGPADANPSNRRFLGELGWTTVTGLTAGNAYFKTMKGGAVSLTPTGSDILEFLSANTAITILAQSGTTPQSMKFTFNVGSVDHNSLLNYVANQHIDHSAVTLTAGLAISGGGDITTSRNFDFAPSELTINGAPALTDYAVMDVAAGGPRRVLWSSINGMLNHNTLNNYVANQHIDHSGVSMVASTGLSGGGDITTSRSFSLAINSLTLATPAAGTSVLAFYDSGSGLHSKVTVSGLNGVLDHNTLLNYVASQHVDHTAVSVSTTEGIQGGGTIAATRTHKLDISGLVADSAPALNDYVATYDTSASGHKKVALSDLPRGISDAPSDGLWYARQNGGWLSIPKIAVGTTAPSSPAVNDVWIDTN